MITISGTTITLTRGDTASIVLSITDSDGNAVPLVSGDAIYFTVKKTTATTKKLLQKVVEEFDNGSAQIDIGATDTKTIEFGEYVYDIQVNRDADSSVSTVIGPAKFVLAEEVTYE